MNTSINVDNQQYQLFCTSKSNAPTYIDATRTFNNGMDFFFGSDSDTATIYLVPKKKVAKFKTLINSIIDDIEQNEDPSKFYENKIYDLAFLYKETNDSTYDIFISNFSMDMINIDIYQSDIDTLNYIADFIVSGGADFSDETIFDFILSYLIQNHKDVIDSVYQSYADDIENYDIDFNDFEMMNNTDDDDIIIKFIQLLSSNIPNVIQNQNGDIMDLNLIKECLIAV